MLFKELTENEIYMMDGYRKAYAFSGSPIMASMEHILREWNAQKVDLFKMLGNQLIISKDIEYKKSYDDIYTEISDMCEDYSRYGRAERSGRKFYDNYYYWVNDSFPMTYGIYMKYNEEEAIEKERLNHINGCLLALIRFDNLSKNEYSGETFTLPLPDGKEMKIPHGCKPIRILGKIAQKFNLEGFEDFRICHSQILNQKTLKGRLSLSIHPMDYMTMSDNNCGWESCMNWMEEGGYRQGTVEMMNSPTVVVAYLSSETDMKMPFSPDCSWNNKKWRKLFVVDKNCIASVKDYPYSNESLTKIIMKWLKNLAETNLGWSYGSELLDWNGHSPLYCKVLDKEIDLFFNTNSMYSDFGSTDHWVYFSNNLTGEDLHRSSLLSIPYSGASECMACGDLQPDLNDDCNLVCDSCEPHYHCCCCGDSIDSDEEYYEIDGQILCEYCYENETVECALSEYSHLRENMNTIYVVSDRVFSEISQELPSYCSYSPSCYYFDDFTQEQFEEDMLVPGAKVHRFFCGSWSHIDCVFFSDMNERFRNYLGIPQDETNEDYENFLMSNGRIQYLSVDRKKDLF